MTDKTPGRTSKCRSCDAEIVWASTEKGKVMPCNLEPDPENGTFFLFRRPDKIEAVFHKSNSRSGEAGRSKALKLYSSHFSTCTSASNHRK